MPSLSTRAGLANWRTPSVASLIPGSCVFLQKHDAKKHLIHTVPVHVVVGLFARRDKTKAAGRNKRNKSVHESQKTRGTSFRKL
jgi:hypothetical protein